MVLPSNQTVAFGVVAWNFLPLMRMVPEALPMPPTILKLALTPSFTVMLAAALSSTLFAVCAIAAVLMSAARIRKQIFFILPFFLFTFLLFYLYLRLLSKLFRLTSSRTITSRGLLPIAAPTTPAFSN